MKIQTLVLACLPVFAGTLVSRADVKPNPLFADSAVLQHGMQLPVWGKADPGEKVTVEFDGQTVSTVAAPDGKWLVSLQPLKAGATGTLKISGRNRIERKNIVAGDVWVCSGQSNMERQLGLRSGQPPILNWEREAAAANFPLIRHFGVAQIKSHSPEAEVQGSWAVCSPETVTNFSAVGYFFGRDLHRARQVPIGLIHSAWGGTPAEAWTSETTLRTFPEFTEAIAEMKRVAQDPELARRRLRESQEAWFARVDPGSRARPAWYDPEMETTGWKSMTLPAAWESAGYADFDGVFWFRRTFDLPANWDGEDIELHLGAIDDDDTTWVNGREVGSTAGWNVPRVYRVPANVLKKSGNVVAVRVLDYAVGGGFAPGPERMRAKAAGGSGEVPLSGEWSCKPGVSLRTSGWPPNDFGQSASAPSVLYNGMIAPLQPFAIRGVIWYQGEANSDRARQYQTLFPAMIADWRRAWGLGDFPFLFVQIAPYRDMSPEIREAQLITWQKTTNTAMVVTIDCGDANDIHPANKEPVGARLALAARAVAYREPVEYSGPVWKAMTVQSGAAILHFDHVGGGLEARDGDLKGFTIAGTDKVFRPARAEIHGDTVVVRSEEVPVPVAVRYGWANVPEGNLFNRAGLPASPFRTDSRAFNEGSSAPGNP